MRTSQENREDDMKKGSTKLELPISLDDILRGKSVEWERLECRRTEIRGQKTAR